MGAPATCAHVKPALDALDALLGANPADDAFTDRVRWL
jgi:hypothetical protein